MRDIETIDGELRRLARAWREASHLSYGLGTAHIDEVQGERAETNRLRGWGCHVSLGDLVARIVAFVRAGYPQGVPETDYIPLLALLRRRLSDDEVAAVAAHLAGRGELHADTADIGTAITKITDELPSLADLDRVQRRLEAIGWPAEPDD